MIQCAKFEDGPLAGRMAEIEFPEPFHRGMIVDLGDARYTVRNGPIAECIERNQQPFKHGMILLQWVDRMSQSEEAARAAMVQLFVNRN